MCGSSLSSSLGGGVESDSSPSSVPPGTHLGSTISSYNFGSAATSSKLAASNQCSHSAGGRGRTGLTGLSIRNQFSSSVVSPPSQAGV